MKRYLIPIAIVLFGSTILIANAGLLTPGSQSGGLLTPGLFKLVGSSLLPGNSSWILGTSTQRISEGWFGTLNANTSTIGTLTISTSIGSGFTNGSILFATSSGIISQDNSNFFYDNSSHSLGIGIGTTTPSALIHGIKTTEQLRLGYDVSNYFSFSVGSTGFTTLNAAGTSPAINFPDQVYLAFTGNSVRIAGDIYFDNANKGLKNASGDIYITPTVNTIFNAGSVGIVTTSPIEKLHVVGNTYLQGTNYVSEGSTIGSYSGNGANIVFSNANGLTFRYGSGSNGATQNATTGNWLFNKDVSITGNVGIGTTAPNRKLDVQNIVGVEDTTGTEKIYLYAEGGGADVFFTGANGSVRFDTRSGGNSYINNGNVGIGTTNPGAKLSVNGNIEIQNSGTTRYILTNETNTGTGKLVMQAGGGSAAYGSN
ncbi:hypothetical protein M0R04_10230 [Candidatus Dojkabacteria bacterium]|jgi:hypothetical protein|nr:hypothetical protein [Candidatus Dojkabacteria bacterium]